MAAEGGFVLSHRGVLAAYPWAQQTFYRMDRGIWEGVCPHGVGHPIGVLDRKCDGIHGCDGCCSGGKR